MKLITIIGVLASILTAISMMPQLIKIIKEKEAESVSLGMLAVLFGGLSMWIWYGFLIHDLIIIISNCFSALVNIVTVVLTIRYKKSIK
jgi:MtN3 and saliva related transmembrane protein